MKETTVLILTMGILIIVECILTFGIFKMNGQLKTTGKKIDSVVSGLDDGLKIADDSKESLKYIADSMKSKKGLFNIFKNDKKIL